MKKEYKIKKSSNPKSKNTHGIISEPKITKRAQGASANIQAGAELDIEVPFEPIASELADADEKFRNKTSSVPGPNSLVFTPQEPKIRIPTSVMIKSSVQPPSLKDKDLNQIQKMAMTKTPTYSQGVLDHEQHYDFDGVTRVDGKTVIPSNTNVENVAHKIQHKGRSLC